MIDQTLWILPEGPGLLRANGSAALVARARIRDAELEDVWRVWVPSPEGEGPIDVIRLKGGRLLVYGETWMIMLLG